MKKEEFYDNLGYLLTTHGFVSDKVAMSWIRTEECTLPVDDSICRRIIRKVIPNTQVIRNTVFEATKESVQNGDWWVQISHYTQEIQKGENETYVENWHTPTLQEHIQMSKEGLKGFAITFGFDK